MRSTGIVNHKITNVFRKAANNPSSVWFYKHSIKQNNKQMRSN